ncbi:MAG: TolC family protein [Tannerella sp.]|jgi:outer membrane protein TolC|nr:TolC family protein [Tannerella sp.]
METNSLLKITGRAIVFLCLSVSSAAQQAAPDTLRLTLHDAIRLAQLQSVDAAVALNELKTSYWEYRTYKADQLPEVNFTGTLPSYNNNYGKYQQSDGSYTYVQNNWLGLNGAISVEQNIALTGGRISLNSSLDFTRQLGRGAYNEYMSIPVGITLVQPVFGVNHQKWNRRIEPLRYRAAQAAFIERTEDVTIGAISYFFNLLQAGENLHIALQNMANAGKLHEIAVAKRKIGSISESELMQLELSALQAKGVVTEALSNLNACMFQLRSFLSLSEQEVIEPVMPERLPSSLRMHYADVLEKAQANNAFARNILRRQLEADYAVASARGNRRSINLFASVGYTGKDRTLTPSYEQLRGNQVVEVGVSIPILDWGKRRGKVKVAESNREVILSRTRQEQMTFNQNIFLLVENFNNQAGQLEIAGQADRIADKRYNTSIETFLTGKISVLDLNDARRSKDEAKLKHITELYKYWNYYYHIRSVTLYDFLANRTLDAEFEALVKK